VWCRWQLLGGSFAVVAAVVALPSCGGGSGAARPKQVDASTSSSAAAGSTAPAPTTTANANALGQEFQSGHVHLTVTSARMAHDYVTANEDVPEGTGRVAVISTTVHSEGAESSPPRCAYPVATNVVDTTGRRYRPVKDLYEVYGNPACHARADRGSGLDITFVYGVPTRARIVAFEFRDVTDPTGPRRETVRVPIQPS
jgi:hypothetical protein